MLKLILIDGSTNGLLPRVCSIEQLRFRRRTLTPPPWLAPKQRSVVKVLTPEERAKFEVEFFDKFTSDVWSPTTVNPKPVPEGPREWSETSKRVGLVARKIGAHPMWFKDGTRTIVTLLEVPENHVISAIDPETWFKTSLIGKQKAFNRFGEMWRVMVGAIDVSPDIFDSILSSHV
ncbi:39S ribosomal protein L3, mitochondrial [Aphelenchoides bicaudatus]|nr:39S ribosomal protein L3, mitochondrial [Aphelenchoides bicaudatus]